MKVLRILTGAHAGAQIRLTPGTWRLSRDADADIFLSDWQSDDVTLTVHENGTATVQRAAAESAPGEEALLADWVALTFGEIAICVGADDLEWPSDLKLLAGLWQPPSSSSSAGPIRSVTKPHNSAFRTTSLVLACTALVGGTFATGLLLLGTQPSLAANVPIDIHTAASRVRDALDAAGLKDLSVTTQGRSVVVRGIVSTAADNATARRVINRAAPGKVVREYDVAQSDIENLKQSLHADGTQVTYLGGGVFRVSGQVSSLKDFHNAIKSISADADSNVKRIETDVQEVPEQAPAPGIDLSEIVEAGGLHYVETTDGTKHLYPSSGTVTQ
jgi:type III secretion protein D